MILQEADLRARLERLERQRDLALTQEEISVADVQMARLEIEEARVQLKQIALQREHLTIRAPISGTVLSGDLERAAGMPIERGQILFEIGATSPMRAELRVPSNDVGLVSVGQTVRLRLAAFPEEVWEGTVTRIHARSLADDAHNSFIVEVPFPEASGLNLRAGLDGRAVIQGDRIPLGAQLSRRLVDFVRLTVFW